MAITIGPIIGLVTGTSARVLFETNADGGVAVELRRGAAVAASATVAMKRLVPRATTLTGLSPGVRYRLTLRELRDGETREGSLRTPDTAGSVFHVAAVSCNQIMQETPASGWSRLSKRIEDQKAPIDVLLHIGDQVYGDAIRGHGKSTFTECVEYLSTAPRGRTSWPSLVPWVTEQYRALYRSWWSVPAVAEVLANVSNLMIWDDHEVSDDWGDDNKFADPKLPQHFVAQGAWRAFHEYQRQLWDEGAAARPIGAPECFHQTIGDVGLLFLDLRGGRGFSIYDRQARRPRTTTPYLGPAQWKLVRAALSGPLRNARLLIVACPVPLAYIGPDWADAYPLQFEDDVRGQWSYRLNQPEQLALMRVLFNWRDANPRTEIAIVAGDVHLGARTAIERVSDGERIVQLITSPIHRAPFSSIHYGILKGFIAGSPSAGLGTRPLPSEFTWSSTNIVNRPNYGVLSADLEPSGRPTIAASLG